MNVTIEASWTDSDLTFQHPRTNYGEYYYALFSINVTTERIYTLTSESSLINYGLLYSPSFYDAMPWENLIASDYDPDRAGEFSIRYHLQPDVAYYLVVTTEWPMVTGTFKVIVSGSTAASITRIIRKNRSLHG